MLLSFSTKRSQHLEILFHNLAQSLRIECRRGVVQGHNGHPSVGCFGFQDAAMQIADLLTSLWKVVMIQMATQTPYQLLSGTRRDSKSSDRL
jgi:hypothetical protein